MERAAYLEAREAGDALGDLHRHASVAKVLWARSDSGFRGWILPQDSDAKTRRHLHGLFFAIK